ncbi:MAG: phosphopyruvate hydratase [Actinomycetota bacterium]|nr:phosphopyruvate hydratase [Actinomycetota bacterium]
MKNLISDIKSRMILDSRGNPTIEAEVILNGGIKGLASVPSGASTGTLEAHELRDGGSKYQGKGVEKALSNIETYIKPELIGEDCSKQDLIDTKLIDLDGTENKKKLGANSMLAVSLANIRAHSSLVGKDLFELIPAVYGEPKLPLPLMNILNGGAHADNNIDIQEFMIVPHGFSRYSDCMRAGVEIYHVLKGELKKDMMSTNVGDEGGFAPNLESSQVALDIIIDAISKAGYTPGQEVSLALDVASSEFYKDGKYIVEGNELNSEEMSSFLSNLVDKYPIISIEDGMAESDWEGWRNLTEALGSKIQLVGDDLFVTNESILEKGIEKRCANSILIKLNQVGTFTETINTLKLAKENGYTSVISHRSGETEDSFISHLAIGVGCGQIKTGAPARTERTTKFNEILRLSEKLGDEVFDNESWKI